MPETVGAFVALLLLVSPGLAFELLRERSRPRRSASAFRETAQIVLASVVFGGAATFLLWLQQRGGDDRLPDIELLLTDRARYVADHFEVAITGLIAQVILSVALAAGWHYLLLNLRPGGSYTSNDGWHELIHGAANPRRDPVFLSVEMTDGSRWRGYTKGVERGEDGAVVGFTLRAGPSGTIEHTLPGGTTTPLHADWAYVVLTADRIKSISVSYL